MYGFYFPRVYGICTYNVIGTFGHPQRIYLYVRMWYGNKSMWSERLTLTYVYKKSDD